MLSGLFLKDAAGNPAPWRISWEVFALIAGQLGFGAAQFASKRKTQFRPEELARADAIKNGPGRLSPGVEERRAVDDPGTEFTP